MADWLVKTEPETYSWADLLKEGTGRWDGVRNFAARNNLRAMALKDRVFIYHSVTERAVVGVAAVVRCAYPDPTAKEGDWAAVDLRPKGALKSPVTLQQIRDEASLSEVALIKRSRLSVVPLTQEQFDVILAMGGGTRRVR